MSKIILTDDGTLDTVLMTEGDTMGKKRDRRIPPCAAAMGCLCAGHAYGDPVDSPCDTEEVHLYADSRWGQAGRRTAGGRCGPRR